MARMEAKPALVKLPPVMGESPTWNQTLLNRISQTKITNNFSILLPIAQRARQIAIAHHDEPTKDRLEVFVERIMEMKTVADGSAGLLPAISNSLPANDSLQQELPGLKFLGESPVSISDQEVIVKEVLDNATEPVVFLSDSHVTLLPQLRAAGEFQAGQQTAVFFIDAHADIVTLATENPYSMQPPHKANVAREIVSEGLAKSVVIAGIDQTLFDEISTGFSRRRADVINTHLYYQQHKDSIILSPTGANQIRAKELVASLKRQGISNLVFSVDIDALSDAGTAMEYTPFAQLAMLSCMQLQSVANLDLNSDQAVIDASARLLQALENPYLAGNLFAPDLTTEEFMSLQEVSSMAGIRGNTRLKDAISLIKEVKAACGKEGISLGIKLPNGGTYVGDLTEITGTDINGITAKAAKQITSELTHGIV